MKDGKRTKCADLVWKPRLLLEMKTKGEGLQQHYAQAFDYWLHLVPNRPRYVVLCNFDEFWIYDFNKNLFGGRVSADRAVHFCGGLDFHERPLREPDKLPVGAYERLIGAGRDARIMRVFAIQCQFQIVR